MRAQALLLLILPVAACGRGDSNIIRGTVEMDQVDVAPQQAARVLQMLVNEGDAVAPGDTIAILGLADASAQVSAREARVRQAEAAVRDLKAGDFVVLPPGTPHWFSKIDGSITYVETRFASGK